MMRIGGYGRVPQGDVNLANMSQAHMMALSQQVMLVMNSYSKCRLLNRVCKKLLSRI